MGRESKYKLWYCPSGPKYTEDGQKKVPHNQRSSQLKWWSRNTIFDIDERMG